MSYLFTQYSSVELIRSSCHILNSTGSFDFHEASDDFVPLEDIERTVPYNEKYEGLLFSEKSDFIPYSKSTYFAGCDYRIVELSQHSVPPVPNNIHIDHTNTRPREIIKALHKETKPQDQVGVTKESLYSLRLSKPSERWNADQQIEKRKAYQKALKDIFSKTGGKEQARIAAKKAIQIIRDSNSSLLAARPQN